MRRKYNGNAVVEKQFQNSKVIYCLGIRKVFLEDLELVER